MLLAHVLDVSRARLHVHPETAVAFGDATRFRSLVARRASRIPLQHLTGYQEFWSLRFEVTPEVLIPRPETEHLIETLLRTNRMDRPVVVDVGTGSGCLAVVVAREVPGAVVHAVDISAAGLEVARRNAAAHGVAGRIAFHRGDLLEPMESLGLRRSVDVLLSNPPYIGAADLNSLQPEVRDHEPLAALSPGQDAIAIHRRLAGEGPPFLRPGGHLIVEIGQGQEAALRALYGDADGLEVLEVVPDLAGIPRVLLARALPGGALPASRSGAR